jgi:bifunctional ADP-heptose synthase (sugar kinase/adenylyltransferase)
MPSDNGDDHDWASVDNDVRCLTCGAYWGPTLEEKTTETCTEVKRNKQIGKLAWEKNMPGYTEVMNAVDALHRADPLRQALLSADTALNLGFKLNVVSRSEQGSPFLTRDQIQSVLNALAKEFGVKR